MIVHHTDRQGQPWAFEVDGKTQAEMLADTLRRVGKMDATAALRLDYYTTDTDSAGFCDTVERVVLDALAEKFPAPVVDLPPTPEQAPPPAPQPVRTMAEAERPDPFYWENF